jgi:tight adherence protein B
MKKGFTKKIQANYRATVFPLISAPVVLLVSNSIFIALAFAAFISIFLTIAQQKNNSKRANLIETSCPELIDILISGAQAGLSLNESLSSLAIRGPEVLKENFSQFHKNIVSNGDFDLALREVQASLEHPSTDLIFEALQISKVLGGAELITILLLLGNFIREDLTLRREIAVKHNWIRNSAHMSAAAPWLLLLLLSTQPSTSSAFSTPTGISILITGLALTALAYLWMNNLSKLPVATRVFTSNFEMEKM